MLFAFLLISIFIVLAYFLYTYSLFDKRQIVYLLTEYSNGHILLVLYIIASIIIIPITPLTIIGGIFLGPQVTVFYAILGTTIGAIFSFSISRFFGNDYIHGYIEKKYKKIWNIDHLIEKHGFFYVLIMRLIGIIPFGAMSLIFGLSLIKLPHFILGTVLGILPATLVYAYFGNTLSHFSILNVILILIYLIILICVTLYFRKKFKI